MSVNRMIPLIKTFVHKIISCQKLFAKNVKFKKKLKKCIF